MRSIAERGGLIASRLLNKEGLTIFRHRTEAHWSTPLIGETPVDLRPARSFRPGRRAVKRQSHRLFPPGALRRCRGAEENGASRTRDRAKHWPFCRLAGRRS